MNLLIIGHARHGKDTLAEMLCARHAMMFESSSVAASRIFLYDALKEKYGYTSPEQCFEDRVNRRKEWHDAICEYNKHDKARLAKDIMTNAHIYVGMRSQAEIAECKRQGVFDLIIGVFNPRKPLESTDSFDIDLWQEADIVIPNSGTVGDLMTRVYKLDNLFNP